MIYLISNHSSAWKLRKQGHNMGWLIGHGGWRAPVRHGHDPMPYALDNGMYFPYGTEPHGPHRLCEFFGRCGKALQVHAPLFAVVPDMPYCAATTQKLYTKWIKRCRDLAPAWRWGIAVQDGMVPRDIERLGVGLDPARDAVCVGGSTNWKVSTISMWAKWCRERNVWCHVLRVNTESRTQLCVDEGVSSVDGTGMFPWGSATAASGVLGVAAAGFVLRSEAAITPAGVEAIGGGQ